ncbi:CHRD domain-containing protein [Falsiroseomonas sp.]|uniref:CHRD domain-containing protein n=1 Tax=Falsiroseomonas sp. TaxID=2870721 RepID=UPI0035673596
MRAVLYGSAAMLLGLGFGLTPLRTAAAAPMVFTTVLGPEAPGATGSGNGTVVVDPVANTLSVSFDFSGLSGVTTVAHIHCCTASPGTGTVGVAVTPGTLTGFLPGFMAGTYSNSFDTEAAATYAAGFLTGSGGGTPAGAEAALIAGMLAGTAYINIHSSTFGGGEIRGFLTAVPEPASLGLFAVGLAGFAALRRRRTPAA